jgi:threonylcarbamoyladenosine tRNA methylthiotransferase MtaB
MRQELEGVGLVSTASVAEADLAVVNTCTVTSEADRDARRLIRRLARENPDLRVLVAGCSAALREAEYAEMAEVWRVVPGQDAVEVARAAGSAAGQRPGPGERLIRIRGSGRGLLTRFRRGTRAWLKVQDGCDRRCSFCATRIARGASRSRQPEELVREAGLLAAEHPELVITGIHIGHYGADLGDSCTLAGLCALLLDEVPDVRIRLSSIEATEIDDDMVSLMVESGGRLVPHLHVPLQSGSDAVLRRMRRWHTREDYRARTLEIASRLPYLGLGADIIAGFPGETDADHEATLALVDELPYTYLHVFPFSARSGTAAASLAAPVRGDVKAARARELRELGLAKGASYRAARIGGGAEVIVETADSGSRTNGAEPQPAVGLTEDYLRVRIADESGRTGPADRDALRPGSVFCGVLEGEPDRLTVAFA